MSKLDYWRNLITDLYVENHFSNEKDDEMDIAVNTVLHRNGPAPPLGTPTDPGVTARPCGSVVKWSGCSHGLRGVPGFESRPGQVFFFFFLSHDIWCIRTRAASKLCT